MDHQQQQTQPLTARHAALADAPEEADAGTPGGEHGITRAGFATVTRLDEARREIELCASSEAVDSYGTVFAYEASKDAFRRWEGNVREMHALRAVGKRVEAHYDDAARKVYVRVRISLGAEDTWQKVLDGTLRGASIGARNVVWQFCTAWPYDKGVKIPDAIWRGEPGKVSGYYNMGRVSGDHRITFAPEPGAKLPPPLKKEREREERSITSPSRRGERGTSLRAAASARRHAAIPLMPAGLATIDTGAPRR